MINLKLAFILLLLTFISSTIDSHTYEEQQISKEQEQQILSSLPYQNHTVSIDQQYTFKLKPKASLMLFISNTSSTTTNIFMDYLSNFPFQTCFISNTKLCATDKILHKSHEGTIQASITNLEEGLLLENPHQTLYISVQIRLYTIEKACNILAARQLYRKQLKEELCFVHEIQMQKNIQIWLQSEALIDLKYEFWICDKATSIQISQSNRFQISTGTIDQKCNGESSKYLNIKIRPANINTTTSQDSQIYYLLVVLQYPDEAVLLPDGVGYTTQLTSSSPKLFFYQLLNFLSITVTVQTKEGIEIFASIVDEAFVQDTVPSDKDNHFNSKAGFIFSYYKPFLTISQAQIEQHNKCENCYLVVSLYLQKSSKVSASQVTIQIVQHYSSLSTGVMKHNYLPKSSIAYYKYFSEKMKMIYIEISDDNQYCTKVYFGTNQNPSEAQHLLKYENKQIVYMAKKDEAYYLGVEAVENCAYSLVIYDSTNNITFLEKGRFGFLLLQEGASKVYIVKADDSQYLKFISVHVYGSVDIVLNRTTLQHINNIRNYNYNFSAFEKKGQYNNMLILDKSEKQFCKRCYYLVGIIAKKHTQSSFFYGDESTPIPIRDKIIDDFIPKKGTIVAAEYYGEERSQFELMVRSGQLRLNFHNDKKKYERVFQKSGDAYIDSFDLQIKSEGILDSIVHIITRNPISVTFQALQDNTIYTLKLKPLEKNGSEAEETVKYKNVSLRAGDEQFQLINPGEITCISGFLRDKKQRIIITSDYIDREKLSNLKITAQVLDKKVEPSIERAQNIITLSFPSLSNYLMSAGVQFDIFLTIERSKIWLFIMQDQQFSVLPSEVDVMVQNEYTFITHAQSDLIIDVFECDGKSSLAYSSTIEGLTDPEEKKLDLVGLSNQPHAVRIDRFSTTFFKVTAPKAIMRWFPMKIDDSIGTGYLDYEVGHLLYRSVFNGIQLNWDSLRKVKKSSSDIINITYHLFVSPNQNHLKASSQCELTKDVDVLRKDNIIDASKTMHLNITHTYVLGRNDLNQRWTATALFATIIADVVIQPTPAKHQNNTDERYRFIYPIIQIPQQLLALSYSAKLNTMSITQISTLILLVIVGVTILAYVCLKKIAPLLGILKNRWLIEEQGEDNVRNPGTQAQQGMMEVPPSSDRKGINVNHQVIEKDEYIEAK